MGLLFSSLLKTLKEFRAMGLLSSSLAMGRRLAPRAIGFGVGASLINSSLYIVSCGERAILFDRFRGVLDHTTGEGIHFVVPWLQKPYIFNIRTRPLTFSSSFSTKDLQMVNLTLYLLSHPEVDRLPVIFKTLGLEYDKKVLPSISNEVLKAVVAQFNNDQLHTERPHFSALVRESFIRSARDFNIVLDNVSITHIRDSAEFSKAVENSAYQEAEQSKFIGSKAEQERRAEIAETLAKTPNVVYVPGGILR